jgi:hypothetical protein
VKARDAFGVVVRTVGLIVVLAGHYYVISAISIMMMVRSTGISGILGEGAAQSAVAAPTNAAILMGVVALILGLFLLLRAETVVNVTYGKADRA